MGNRVFQAGVALISIILLSSTPIYGSPTAIREVVQIIVSGHHPPRLRLNLPPHYADPRNDIFQQPSERPKEKIAPAAANSKNSPDSLLCGATVSSDAAGSDLSMIDEGEVEGTICDCGEIAPLGGGLPKWPLLFIGAAPLFLIHGCRECETPTQTPSVPPTTPHMPEPASLFLFGLALLVFASLRRQRRQIRMPNHKIYRLK